MSHYAKLATLTFRIIAVSLLVYALLALFVLAKLAAGPGSSAMLLPGVAALVVAILLYLAAPPLGRLAARGLTDLDRTP